MRIVVGSTNPAKTSAVRAVCVQAFLQCELLEREVPSGVRAQPIGEEETAAGARTRARGALAAVEGAALGVGLEGGVDAQGRLINCVAVLGADGRENLAWGVSFPLPPGVAQRVLAGEELGPVMDALTGLQQSKRTLGAVGILTDGLFTRAQMWQGPLACALIPFLHPELYPR
ncbi:inosine/xanthosine triphosphatase [Aggregicoccus sp. 17bor-14]|uniref:inosine/xanthosine triphosphatase n=1 Tax=Myxococcaceae TaxID=31 RepID=UPI00129D0936|nr:MULTISPECIES: inosine/xanthosine triphosphatase [Myxococcaceae]MBF5046169.1 inosine/xanthosine triphosphatase [Simulacricoccus sp. 17bor-14]MRI91894.1 inosine/xanthosine triphosphatase [Aggregicoccus sp. 17bor-14]